MDLRGGKRRAVWAWMAVASIAGACAPEQGEPEAASAARAPLRTVGTDGPDHLFGGDGDDYLAGGEGADVLTGGAGRDELIAGGGRDVVVVLDACELARGEILDGGPGDDVLYAPMGADELRARGVTVEGFERVVSFDASALGCDPTTCRCAAPFIPGTSAGADPCDMRALTAEGIDTRELRAACEDFLANATSMVFDLPDSPTAADMEAMIALDPPPRGGGRDPPSTRGARVRSDRSRVAER